MARAAQAQTTPPGSGQPNARADVQSNDGLAVQFWSGSDIASLIKSPDLALLHERWRRMVVLHLPRLNEFVGSDPNTVLANAMLLMPTSAHDLLFVHHGVGLAKILGVNFTGRLHSELTGATPAAIQRVYLKAVEIGQPFYLRFVSSFSQQHFYIEQLILPLAADNSRGVGLLLVYGAPMDDQLEVLKAVFERSPIGMIAAAADFDEGGKLKDGRVLLINGRARAILKIEEAQHRLAFVSDLGPWFRSGALWTKTKVVSNSGQTHILYRDQNSGENYRLTIEPFDRFVLFSIVELPKAEDEAPAPQG